MIFYMKFIMCTNNGYSRIYIYTLQKYIICIATIYNEKLNISFEEVYHQKQFSFTCTIHKQPNKSQLYNKRVFFWKSKKSFYFQIRWWIIVHLYNVIIGIIIYSTLYYVLMKKRNFRLHTVLTFLYLSYFSSMQEEQRV